MKEKLLELFNTHFFTIDGGGVLTKCEITDDEIICREMDEDEEIETIFPMGSLDLAHSNDSGIVYIEDAEGFLCSVRFYSTKLVKIHK